MLGVTGAAAPDRSGRDGSRRTDDLSFRHTRATKPEIINLAMSHWPQRDLSGREIQDACRRVRIYGWFVMLLDGGTWHVEVWLVAQAGPAGNGRKRRHAGATMGMPSLA